MDATLHTSLGDIRLELYTGQAPTTVGNFVGLATGTRTWLDPRTGEETTAPLYDGDWEQRRKAADLFDYRFEDLKLVGYKPDPSIKMPVAV